MGTFIGIIITIVFVYYALVWPIKRIRKIKATWNQLGFKLKDMIDAGKYTYGHPDIDAPYELSYLMVINGKIEMFKVPLNQAPVLMGSIPGDMIKDITIEDASTIERRVTAARLLLTGVFAFGLKKKKKNDLSYLVIEWQDRNFTHQTTFEFTEKGAMERSNKARNALIRLTR
ncbi:MAG: hypothetical protein WCO44_12490 [Bacteroidota bacterium]